MPHPGMGHPSLTSLPTDDEKSCGVRSPKVTHLKLDLTRPSLTSVTDENCLNNSATHPVKTLDRKLKV